MPHDNRPSLVVFADDYGRHPSSCQHLVNCLLDQYRVLWVNTLGTRKPKLCLADARRAAERMQQWLASKTRTQQSTNPTIISPMMWPGFAHPIARAANRRLIIRAVTRTLRHWHHNPPTVLTTLPITADLVGQLPAKHWVYYCVDNLADWPNLDRPTLLAMEQQLVRTVDATAAVGPVLAEHLQHLGANPTVIPHGIDLDLWRQPKPVIDHPTHHRLAALPHPRLVYWGLIDRRIDWQSIDQLAAAMPNASLVFIGPRQLQSTDLPDAANLHLLPAVEHDQLPHIAAQADALLLPYADLPVTRAIEPLKLIEYLMTDLPVIVRKIPATVTWSDCCDVCNETTFVDTVTQRLQAGPAQSQRNARRHRMAHQSWADRADQLNALLQANI